MTLELFVCSSTRECSRDEQLGMSLAFVERVNTLVVLDALVVLVRLKIKDLMIPFIEVTEVA